MHVEHVLGSGTDVNVLPVPLPAVAEGRESVDGRRAHGDDEDEFQDAVAYQPDAAAGPPRPPKGSDDPDAGLEMPPETVHDPYVKAQWARLKKLSDPIPPMRSLDLDEQAGGAGAAPGAAADAHPSSADDLADVMDRHFRAVLDLQNEIAAMHLELEDGGDIKAANRQSADPASTAPPDAAASGPPPKPTDKDKPKEDSLADSSAADDAGFEALQRREEGVKEIFGRVDELSRMLSEFHALRLPKLAFSFDEEGGAGETEGTGTGRAEKAPAKPA